MLISIFYMLLIGSVILIHSGMSFRCYVCNSNGDEYCEDKPTLIARCPYSATGCVKIINQMVEYKFVNPTGGEITIAEWDGVDTDWKAVPYVQKIVTRRCGNNYARYQPRTGCIPIPLKSNNKSEEIICYCKSELCNAAVKSEKKFLSYVYLVLMSLYVS